MHHKVLEQQLQNILAPGVYILKHNVKLGIIALFKPSGILSHPNSSLSIDGRSILNLPYNLKTESFYCKGSPFFSQFHLLHRIDLTTSGILLISYVEDTALKVKKMFEDRIVRKKYIACCFGRLAAGEIYWKDSIEVRKENGRTVCRITSSDIQKTKVAETKVLEKKWNHEKRISMIE